MTDSALHNESEIVKEIRANDLEAFSGVFRKYYEPLCLFAARYLHDIQAAESVVQDVFVRLWESREALEIQSSLKSYLYAAVRNACINHLKHENFTQLLDDAEERPDTSVMQPDVQLESSELAEALEHAMKALAPKCRQIFTMAKYDGLSYQEIAEILNISVNTVKTQMKRALKSLSGSLQHLQTMMLFLGGWS